METPSTKENKPERLYFRSYLQIIHNSVGSNLFRNFYIKNAAGQEIDALNDGLNSCAFYVSSILTLVEKLSGVHGTVDAAKKDLAESGWRVAAEPTIGDVVVWEAIQTGAGKQEHIGFCIGDGQAISNSETEKTPIQHDITFDGQRQISQIYRMPNW